MAKASLRRFDVQAKLSLVLSFVSLVLCVGLAFLLIRNWRGEVHQIIYKTGGIFTPVFLGMAAVAALLGTFAVALGFNSAGQRRNDLQKRSWIGFFVGMAALTSTFVFLFAFFFLGDKVAG